MKHLKTFAALCCVAALFAACEKNEVLLQTSVSGTENGHDYVDLGLSVKWATCNVDDTAPEGYGKCLAWGETEQKDIYNISTYKYGFSYNQLTKYCTDTLYGFEGFADNQTKLRLTDDAAHAAWGGSWRMPTAAEWQELRDNCT